MQQMMQSVMSNPAMMDMALRSNPQMRAMIDANPHMAGMLQNPQFLQVRPHNLLHVFGFKLPHLSGCNLDGQSMMNPQTLRAVGQAHQQVP